MDSHQQQSNPEFFLDSLYCREEHWVVEEDVEETNNKRTTNPSSHLPLLLLEQDMFYEDEELLYLFTKEKETHFFNTNLYKDPSLSIARREAVEWMLSVNAHYAFSSLTTILSINYFDRFLSHFNFQKDKPWMTQLIAVSCLSLAAKVEETQVPLLLDLQVEEVKYVFEAKTIQRMELLVLSTLHWKMNPVTPLSFLDHIVRMLGFKTQLHSEFPRRRFERLLFYIVVDSRFVSYPPSVLATATMLHVIDQIEPFNSIEYENQLIEVLKISKEKVDDCYQLIRELDLGSQGHSPSHKRKYESIPHSPKGVIDVSFSCDSSKDLGYVGSSISSLPEPMFKRTRVQDKQMQFPSFLQ